MKSQVRVNCFSLFVKEKRLNHLDFFFLEVIFLLSGSMINAQSLDSLQRNHLVVNCFQYGIGHSNIFDSYLSTQEYKGIDFRVSHEKMRMTKLFDGNISAQSYFQSNLSYTHNRVNNNNTLSGLVNWNYGLHYQFHISDNLKILAGSLCDMNLGFVYNLHNSNNPASARAYINMDASGMAIWRFRISKTQLILRYQLNVPFIGVMFSPEMGESYYEIFTLGNHHGIIKVTSFHNQPAIRQFLSLDVPLGGQSMRFSYLMDIQQSNVNNIKTHTYSNVFMVGLVRHLYSIHTKEMKKIPSSLQAY